MLGIIPCPFGPAVASEQTFIVSSAAGNATDIVARQVAKRYGDHKVMNMPNAAGTQGVAEAIKNPDKILIAASSAVTAAPATIKNINYDPEKDLVLLTSIAVIPMILTGNKNLTNIEKFFEYSKKNKVLFGATGYGSVSHLMGLKFKKDNDLDMTVVPYKGTNEALVELLAGRLDIAFMPMPQVLENSELSILPVKFYFWVGAYVSSKVPEEKRKELTAKIKAIVADKDFGNELDKIGLMPIERDIDFVKEINVYKALAKDLGIEPK